jgi:U3-containing 90S pre-ribosomal complex subunit
MPPLNADASTCAPMQACRIHKLFAKHFKVEEQQLLLRESPCAIAVGTPNRLCKLADLGDLKMDSLRLVAIDVSRDKKEQCVALPAALALARAHWMQAAARMHAPKPVP